MKVHQLLCSDNKRILVTGGHDQNSTEIQDKMDSSSKRKPAKGQKLWAWLTCFDNRVFAFGEIMSLHKVNHCLNPQFIIDEGDGTSLIHERSRAHFGISAADSKILTSDALLTRQTRHPD